MGGGLGAERLQILVPSGVDRIREEHEVGVVSGIDPHRDPGEARVAIGIAGEDRSAGRRVGALDVEAESAAHAERRPALVRRHEADGFSAQDAAAAVHPAA